LTNYGSRIVTVSVNNPQAEAKKDKGLFRRAGGAVALI
jgi:hypothetical protein